MILADYCPYIQEFSWKKEGHVIRGSRCSIKENVPGLLILDESIQCALTRVCRKNAPRPWACRKTMP